MKKLNITSWIYPLLLTLFVFSGCTKNDGPTKLKDEGNLIVTIPQSGLFGISGDQEKAIAEIAVLVFNTKGELHRMPIYIAGSKGRPSGDNILFDIELQPRPYSDIMILANATNACADIIDITKVGLPRDQILALLKLQHPDRWNARSDGDYKPIPMWGSSGLIVIKKNQTANMKLVRMLAKVDLDITDPDVANKFKIKEILVCNTNEAGHIIPSKANWDEDNLVVIKPTIPTGFTRNTPLVYTEIKDQRSCIGEIYLFEANNTLVPDPLNAACLVIKARYDADTEDTYYAIHLEKKNDFGTVISEDILRNHKYEINIVSASGSGEGSVEEALKQGKTNIKTVIAVWDDGRFTEGVIDGQNVFKVSKGNFLLSKDAHDATSTENKVTVLSNEVSGWKVSEITYVTGSQTGWLSIADGDKTGVMNQSKEISLLLTPNDDFVDRVGYVHFVAGQLKYKLKVTQRRNAKLSVDKTLFDDIEGFGIGTDKHYSYKIDSVFNISSNTDWKIESSHPDVLTVDKHEGTGDSEIYVVLQPSALYAPKDDYTLTITGDDITTPVVITVKQFGLDIYADKDQGTASRAMPDANFVATCKAHDVVFDGGDGMLSISEAVTFDGELDVWKKSISSLKGVEYFRSITHLICYQNELTTLDVTKNVKLTRLWCDDNQLTTLDVRPHKYLEWLHCQRNQLTALDVTNNVELTRLECGMNQISELDVVNHTKLETLICRINKLTKLGVSDLTKLKELLCDGNQISVLDVTKLSDLTSLWTSRNPLNSFDISNNLKLSALYCSSNNISANISVLDISKHTELVSFDCSDNQLSELDVTKNVKLRALGCNDNRLTALDVTKNVDLTILKCGTNQISELDLTGITKLTELRCNNNRLSTLDVTKNAALEKLQCNNNQLLELSLTGITNLTELNCGSNQLSALDVTKNTALGELYCNNNQLLELDLTGITNLTLLGCGGNQLSTIDVTNNVNLTMLWCDNNTSLTTLDLSRNKVLGLVGAIPSNITTVYVWWPGGGAAGKPVEWKFPVGFDNYVYKP